jgi:hypothetical protein
MIEASRLSTSFQKRILPLVNMERVIKWQERHLSLTPDHAVLYDSETFMLLVHHNFACRT